MLLIISIENFRGFPVVVFRSEKKVENQLLGEPREAVQRDKGQSSQRRNEKVSRFKLQARNVMSEREIRK